MNLWRYLFRHYEAYHAYGPPRLKYAGYFGLVAFSAFYFLRFTRTNAQPYEDVVFRLAGIVLFALLALKDRWPDRLKGYYIGYSYGVTLYGLPFFAILTALQRGGGVPSMSNIFIVLCLLVLLTDWRNTLAMLLLGTAAAVLAYIATATDPRIPMDLVAQLPAFALIVIGGSLFKFSTEQIDAERKLRATQALAGSIAHEMRNPLIRIKHNLERMQHALPPPTTSGKAQAIDGAQADALYRHLAESEVAVKRGLQVIAMTLDEVSAKPVDHGAFVYLWAAEATRKALQEYAFESEEEAERVRIQVDDDFTFRGDETAYLFVIFNLLKNALYYLPAYPRVRVTLTVGQQQVTVHDTGPGMTAAAAASLFQPFTSAGKTGGTGLGLAYCRRVMQAFGGEIFCESVEGESTQFALRFPPVAPDERHARHLDALERARGAFLGKRILIVDDDAAQRLTTRHKLQPLGAEIEQAADGQRALAALARQHYDLVLLDLNMPVLDGYEVAHNVRHGDAPLNRHVPIVAYTSEPAYLAVVKTRKAGMDGFVAKPCAQHELVQVLHEALVRCASRAQPGMLLAGRRILLADDSPHNRKSVSAYLKHAGAVVVEAGHGRAVLEQLQLPGQFDAVLMDINMPGMDGLETASAIRAADGPWRTVPIVALTAHSDDHTVRAAQLAGMTDFIVKPVEAAVLYQKLASLVSGTLAVAVPLRPTFNPVAAVPADTLLNVERLESYARIGMLEELLNDYLPEIAALVIRLENRFEAGDFQGSLEVLHSLLGMSGEAGAQALYQSVRRAYVPMVETRAWPPENGFVVRIAALASETQRALKAYGADHTSA